MPDNGLVERMNGTIKDTTVKRFHYESHDQLRLSDVVAAYNCGRRLKRLCGHCKPWAAEPQRFIADLHHQTPGPNI